MSQDNKINIPSGQGGLTRFSGETGSKIKLSPGIVFIICLLIMVIVILLHYFGPALFEQ